MLVINTLIRCRAPMFTFAFDDVLFRFQYARPAFEPLVQVPSRRGSTHLQSLSIIKGLGVIPQTPLKSFFKKSRPEGHVRNRRRAAQVPVRQARNRAVGPVPAQEGDSLARTLVVVVGIIR